MTDELLAQGLEHYLNGQMRLAAEAWEAVLKADPGNVRAREYLKSALAPQMSRKRAPEVEAAPASATGWDEGPSMAPAVEVSPPDEGLDLDDLTAARPLLTPIGEPAELPGLVRKAKELYDLNDFSGALEMAEKVLRQSPQERGMKALRDECVGTLTAMYESRIGPLSGVPAMAAQPDEIIWLNLDHRAGFVLAQIDGRVSYEDLYAICGMSRIDTAKILAQLLGEKAIVTAR